MKIISSSLGAALTHSLCKTLNASLVDVSYKRFSDGELSVILPPDNITQNDTCLLVHSFSGPVNDSLIAVLLIIDKLKRAGANKILVCVPYLAYARQTHAMSLMISLMRAAGAHACITIDSHSHVIDTAIPLEVLSASQLFADHIKASHDLNDLVIVAPDQGGIERCIKVQEKLGIDFKLAHLDKIRTGGKSEVQAIHGYVRGKRCVIVDDIIDTGTTLCSAADALTQQGAIEVTAYCTHGVLSKGALEHLKQPPIKQLVITDTINPRVDTLNATKIEVISIERVLVERVNQLLKDVTDFF